MFTFKRTYAYENSFNTFYNYRCEVRDPDEPERERKVDDDDGQQTSEKHVQGSSLPLGRGLTASR